MKEYIQIGNLNPKLLNKLNIRIITNEVVFTLERIEHVKEKRYQFYEEVKEILPTAIYNPDYIYQDWNNRDDTLVFIKNIDKNEKINIVIKIAVKYDKKHPKNSIMTIIKIGEKTFRKIYKNKNQYLLFKKLDKNE